MAVSAADRAQPGSRDRDAAVKAAWHALMAAKVASWNALERELGESHGLGVSDFEVLDYLAGRPDGCRSPNLAGAEPLSQRALSRLPDGLERHALVQRSNCVDDRRGINLILTPEGQARHARALRT